MYGKIFDTLFTGSMRGKGDLQLVFMYMIANATQDGICDFTPQCIADATGKSLDLIHQCLKELESPDEMSRTRRDNGRRIELLDAERPWGWQIINHEMYRKIANRESLKEAERQRKREYRSKKRTKCPGHVPDTSGHAGVGVASVSGSKKGESEGEEKKLTFGEFKGVKLTETQYTRLVEKQGEQRLIKGIGVLDDYMRSKGKRYKDHYAVLKETSWVWTRVDQINGTTKKRHNPSEVL